MHLRLDIGFIEFRSTNEHKDLTSPSADHASKTLHPQRAQLHSGIASWCVCFCYVAYHVHLPTRITSQERTMIKLSSFSLLSRLSWECNLSECHNIQIGACFHSRLIAFKDNGVLWTVYYALHVKMELKDINQNMCYYAHHYLNSATQKNWLPNGSFSAVWRLSFTYVCA